jgi:hypothetical protein
MKNIHLISTDKPSVLGYLTKKGREVFKDLRLFGRLMPNILDNENQHIYITSDEEIKEGDWFTDDNNSLKRSYKLSHVQFANPKKIILTTDQDLIKDGVQSIDDEFLEWFVKNPSCEWVEVGYGWIRLAETDNEGYWVSIPDKQFEMQQEEPKQSSMNKGSIDKFLDSLSNDELKEKWNKYEQCSEEENSVTISEFVENTKQETVEEVAERYFPLAEKTGGETYTAYKGFIAGAKWQAERMYSEEEVIKIVEKSRETGLTAEYLLLTVQFKKK